MLLEARDFAGRVTFITGPEKHCGKTTLLNACLALLREGGAGASPRGLAFMGVGFEGEGRDVLSGLRKPRVEVRPGEVFVTAERYLRNSSCLPELLEVLPGSTALGRLAIARAGRAASVTLVGPERNDLAALAIARVREEGWADTVLVDGAINRITQVSSFTGARFLFALRVSRSDLDRQVKRLRLMQALQSLPVDESANAVDGTGVARVYGGAQEDEGEVFFLEGPLTADTARRVPDGARTVVVEDFTKVFLDAQALKAFTRSRGLKVRSAADFGGFVVVLRDLAREDFLAALGDPSLEDLVCFNPYDNAGAAA